MRGVVFILQVRDGLFRKLEQTILERQSYYPSDSIGVESPPSIAWAGQVLIYQGER